MHGEVEQPVVGERGEEVVQEPHPGADVGSARPVEVERDRDVRLAGPPRDGDAASLAGRDVERAEWIVMAVSPGPRAAGWGSA